MIRRRRATRPVRVGGLVIGGRAPVAVQSMTNTRTDDVAATVRQARRLARAGCELVRIAVPDEAAAAALPEIRARLTSRPAREPAPPLCADVHFDHRLALAAIRAGFDKIRINPGNIGAGARTGRAREARVREVIRAAADAGTAIRVGVNAGSLDRRFAGRPTVAAMVASMADCLAPFEALDFRALVLSAKASGVPETVAAYRELSRRWRWPLHLGLTEAGLPFEGAIRSTAALGALLAEGIGDTIRVSLTGDPVLEVAAAWELLAALGLRRRGPLVYACPTCGRTGIDVARLAREVKRALAGCREPLKIAVMGCVVNGPGEARAADYGIAGGRGRGAVFARGRVLRTVPADGLVAELLRAIAAGEDGRTRAGAKGHGAGRG